MKKIIKKILPIIPIMSLLYIRFYESSLYFFAPPNTWQSHIYDLIYSDICIPSFYAVTSFLVFDVIFECFKITCPPRIYYIMKICLLILILCYCCYLFLLILSVIPVTIKPFISPYIILYGILGLLFTFLINKKT